MYRSYYWKYFQRWYNRRGKHTLQARPQAIKTLYVRKIIWDKPWSFAKPRKSERTAFDFKKSGSMPHWPQIMTLTTNVIKYCSSCLFTLLRFCLVVTELNGNKLKKLCAY